MKRILFLALMLTGCASSSEIYGPDGQKYFHISCDGAAVPMSVCWDKAIEVCPKGYFLAGKEDKTGALIGAANTDYGVIGQGTHKSIYVRCKT